MVSQITGVSAVCTIVCSGADQRNHQKLCVTGLCEGNSRVTGEFPTQRASNAENVTIWWHHEISRKSYLHHKGQQEDLRRCYHPVSPWWFGWYFGEEANVDNWWGISRDVIHRWLSLDLYDDKSTLVQVMTRCCQVTSHYPKQYWPIFSPYGVTGPQWVNLLVRLVIRTMVSA